MQHIELDPKHPGINDLEYIKRRTHFYNIARDYRLNDKGLPYIKYTEQENNVWHTVLSKLATVHQAKACRSYIDGKRLLEFNSQAIPQIGELNIKLKALHGVQLVPAEGLIEPKEFFNYLSHKIMPCTMFLRHHSEPEYTPEPDAVHDIIGHLPQLMDAEYTQLIALIGQGVKTASVEQMLAWERIYWFTIEFGLIEAAGELKVFGAGLLSSFGEMEYCYSDQVTRKPFDLETVINTDYDPTLMQEVLFIIPSIQVLINEVETLIRKFNG